MKQHKDGVFSLKWGLSATVAVCWIVPILVIVTVAGVLLNLNYERHVRHAVESGTAHAMEQVQLRVESALEASKAASYDGAVREAYREYETTGNQIQLYSDVTDYLSRAYSRDSNLKAVFITFLDQPDADYSYIVSKGKRSYDILQKYRQEARQPLLDLAGSMDTGIVFTRMGDELYMVRNLMDARLQTYAVLAMLCDEEVLFQSLESISSLTSAQITLDGVVVPLTDSAAEAHQDERKILTEYTIDAQGHELVFRAQAVEQNLWGAMPDLRWAVLIVSLLVVPLVLAAVLLFYRHVTHPVEILVEASNRVEAGERGYQITEQPHTQEFRKLTRHFNSMSTELKSQFERLYLEQQSLQEARIKALQSQINPHFLGNTLEIINWEARLAENDKVSAMIEALSTMLDAAIGRDGRSQIALREELTYVDAYLYIIQQRLGSGLSVTKEIDQRLLEHPIPRLMLQPLVENAVEHDISRRRGSALCIRAYCREEQLYLEVEHEGTISPEDRAKIDSLLSSQADTLGKAGHVGIRNLNQRVKLIYGEKGRLSVEEIRPGQILAQICLPFLPLPGEEQQLGK